MQATIAFDSTEVHRQRDPRGRRTRSSRRCSSSSIVIFLFLGSLRTVLVPDRRHPGVAHRRRLPDAGVRLHAEPAHAARRSCSSVGLVVDDAIVVVENVERHIREGKTPFEAALVGARELVGPIIAMTITLAAVYAPIGFQGGLTGALFREFAFTLAGAVFISGIVALTLSPMMSSRLLTPSTSRAGSRAHDRPRLRGASSSALRARARRARCDARRAVYTVWIVLTLARRSRCTCSRPQELAPNEDQGVVFGALDVPANATLEQLMPYTEQVEPHLRVDAGVRPQLPDHVPAQAASAACS